MRINVSNRIDLNDSCLKLHPLKLICFLLFDEIYITPSLSFFDPKTEKRVFKNYKNKKNLD